MCSHQFYLLDYKTVGEKEREILFNDVYLLSFHMIQFKVIRIHFTVTIFLDLGGNKQFDKKW